LATSRTCDSRAYCRFFWGLLSLQVGRVADVVGAQVGQTRVGHQLACTVLLALAQLVGPGLHCVLELALQNLLPFLQLELDVLLRLLLHDFLEFDAHVIHVHGLLLLFLQRSARDLPGDILLQLELVFVGTLDPLVRQVDLVPVFLFLVAPHHLEGPLPFDREQVGRNVVEQAVVVVQSGLGDRRLPLLARLGVVVLAEDFVLAAGKGGYQEYEVLFVRVVFLFVVDARVRVVLAHVVLVLGDKAVL